MAGRIVAILAVSALAVLGPAAADAAPFQQDPMGPISDVTRQWRHYQPAAAFCVKPDANEYAAGGAGAIATGRNAACRRSGFKRSDTGLVLIRVRTPILCSGCRRLFVDFSKIPAENDPPTSSAHGHVYYHLASSNWTYTVDPIAHSPNTKNFTNDKLLVPEGSPQQPFVNGFDLHAIAYVADTAHFIHTKAQGPYYIGPWYMNRAGQRIKGVFLDLDVADATEYPDPALNAVGYWSGFNSGQSCPADDDGYYGGCFDWWGMSASTVDPYA
ncbi:MAG: hypothetical protein ABR600_07600 [Actinomycetota bacterium]